MSALVASMDGCSIHWMQFSGAPAFKAASYTIRAASDEHFCAFGWNAKIIGFLVFNASKLLKIAVEVGFVTGVKPATTPTGSATSVMPVTGSSLMIPTVFKSRR